MKTVNHLFFLLFSLLIVWGCKDDEAPAPVQDILTANAGLDAATTVGQKIVLDGSLSHDSKDQPLSYLWAIKTKPQGSTAALVKAEEVKAEFTPDVAGAYVFELTVNNGSKTAKDEVGLTANAAPYAGCTPVSTAITTPTTWVKRAPAGQVDYCITEDIWISAKLTIEPGVVVEFEEGKKLQIESNGIIKAIGNASNRIVFTGKNKVKGYWSGIELNATQSEENEFNYVDISFAGRTTHYSGYKAALSLRGASKVKVTNTRFDASAGYGMVVPSGTLVAFAQNTFSNNTAAALYLNAAQIGKLDQETQFAGNNGRDGVEMDGTSINHDTEQFWPALKGGSKYYLMDNVYIASGVKIQEGAELEFALNKGISIDGSNAYLIAKGTADKKIIFTGIEKQKGSWRGIEFNGGVKERSQFDYVELSYAGGNTHVSGYKAGISSRNGAEYSLTNATISHSKGYGVAVQSGNFTAFANNTFSNNAQAGLLLAPSVIGQLDAASKFKGNNGKEGVEVVTGSVNLDEEQIWPAFADGSIYYVMGDIYINSGVKIEAGAVLEFATNKYLTVQGASSYLNAKGTAAKKIKFVGAEKIKGAWKGIEFNITNQDKNELEWVEISHGGSSTQTIGYKCNLSLRNGANVKLYNSKISDSAGWGLVTSGNSVVETSDAKPNTFTANAGGDIKN